MKKKFITIASVMFASLFLFAGCGGGGGTTTGETHRHHYKSTWDYNETEHWYAADCGHDDLRGSVASHTLVVKSTTATCKEGGIDTLECSVCHYTVTREASPLGHEYKTEPEIAPTCERDGRTEKQICTRCGYERGGNVIFATGKHNYSTKWTQGSTTHYHEAICGCSRINDAASHDFNDEGVCQTCGYVYGEEQQHQDALNGQNFVIVADGDSGTVTALDTTDTEVEIPAYYEGKPVTAIAAGAFKGNTTLTSIVIPDSITSIGREAFYGCTALTEIELPARIKKLEDSTFAGSGLTKAVLPTYLEEIGYYVFDECENLAEVEIPAGVSVIHDQAFADTALTSVSLPILVTAISDNLFMNCEELAEVTVFGNLTKIGNQAFYGCKKLESFTVLSTTTYIGQRAFAESGLKQITVPAGVGYIGTYVFENCEALTTATVNANVTRQLGGWFAGCKALTAITVPFVGSHRETGDDDPVIPTSTDFGFYFGRFAGDGLTKVTQHGVDYYIPSDLATVTILGGYLETDAFAGCSMVKTIHAVSVDTKGTLTDWEGTFE